MDGRIPGFWFSIDSEKPIQKIYQILEYLFKSGLQSYTMVQNFDSIHAHIDDPIFFY